MNVLWLTKVASPYKMKMFEKLGNSLNLTIIIRRRTNSKRDASWFINDIKNVRILFYENNCFHILKKEMPKTDIFINSMYSTKAGIQAIILAKIFKKKSILQADGGIPVNRGIFVNLAIKELMLLHNYFLSSSEITDNYFNYYTNNLGHIYHYPFSSLTDHDIMTNFKMSLNKSAYKEELNLNKFTFLSIGQPIYRKGFDLLLKAFKESGLDDQCNLLIIGGKPEETSIEIVNKAHIKNVTFLDSMPYEKLRKYYASADSFILCTREDIWGLVINEAISFNLPFITSDKCVAGLHFNKFYNIGTIIENENIKDFAKAMKTAYYNQSHPNYLEISTQYTIEKTATCCNKILENIFLVNNN